MKRKLILTIMALCILGSLAAKSAKWYFKNGMVHFKKTKNYEKALTSFEKAIKKNPEMFEAYEKAGDCYFKQEDFTKSLEYYKKGIEAYNKQLAETKESRKEKFAKKNEASFKHLTGFIDESEKRLFSAAFKHFQAKEYDKAIAGFESFELTNKELLPNKYSILMVIYSEQKNSAKVKENAIELVKIKPEDIAVKNTLASIYMNEKSYEEALPLYQSMVELDKTAVNYNSLGYAYLLLADKSKKDETAKAQTLDYMKKAVDTFVASLELDAKSASANDALSNIETIAGVATYLNFNDEAIAFFKKALKFKEDKKEILTSILMLNNKLERFADNIALGTEFKQAIEKDKDLVGIMVYSAGKAKNTKAKKAYEKIYKTFK